MTYFHTKADAGGVSFDIQQQVLLPAPFFFSISIFPHDTQISGAIHDHERRANETAQHDETSHVRRQEPQTASAKALRTALSSAFVYSGVTANGRFQNPNRRFLNSVTSEIASYFTLFISAFY